MEYLYIQFQNRISNEEIALFRGAIINHFKDISNQYTSFYKGVGLTAFDVNFQSNILLPRHIGLGKGASINHGVISY